MNLLILASIQDIMNHASIWFIAPVGAALALVMAFVFSRSVMQKSEGEPLMVEIADAVRKGAMAYLARQYKVVGVVFVVLVAVLAILASMGIQEWWTVVGVPIAGLFSGLCGWFGMKMATNASARTAFAAKQSLNDGLTVAFRSGAVMGLVVVGFALFDVSAWFFLWNAFAPENITMVEITAIMLTYGMGASTQALFARVGGGIYTKAADVGADLVGKVEAGIPEDDPRNPATIADNVGDNVGDVAGMGADLYESYYGSMLATMALGAAAAYSILSGSEAGTLAIKLAVAPMALAGLGILCSLIGIFVVKAKEDATFSQLLKSLHSGVWASSFIIFILSLGLFWMLFGDVKEISHWGVWGAIAVGLVAGNVIAVATEYYTSYEHKPTQSISEQAQTGPATVIIGGTAVGMMSTWVPITTIVVSILLAFTFAGGGSNFLLGLYGVGIAAVGMLSTLGITLATDAYGPIADNAGGNAEMSGQPPHVRERTDMLDSLGNTTAATGKGFAIGSAALTALALLAAYVFVVQTSLNQQITPNAAAQAALVAQAEGAVSTSSLRTLSLEYRDFGRFSAVDVTDRSNPRPFAGLMLATDYVRQHFDDAIASGEMKRSFVLRNVEWHDRSNEYQAVISFPHGDHSHDEDITIVPVDRADIRQILAYYDVTLMNPRVLGGIFMGVLLAFVFCAMTMSAVGRAAYRMMNECRRQFSIMRDGFRKSGMSEADIANPMKWPTKVNVDGKQYPDYAECVAISTAGAQREMVIPSLLAIIVPIVVGLILGVGGVMGLLAGGLTSGFAVAIFMANAGGAWDNAKKYIEKGHFGGKGSDAHKAGVVGDTVGDPFKDTSGPSLNILIKLIAIVSVVFAGLIVAYSPQIGAMIGIG
ncbi:MAG TPA: sodium-translocating pyrophosphatase [Phycisphaerales bacterium]|nr:sodium-translocating pyrophosphatase [Phycisphaerales bacterium]